MDEAIASKDRVSPFHRSFTLVFRSYEAAVDTDLVSKHIDSLHDDLAIAK